jgi:hypothetical protein
MSKATRRNLKESRKLQFNFSGGFVTGFRTGAVPILHWRSQADLDATGIPCDFEVVTSGASGS